MRLTRIERYKTEREMKRRMILLFFLIIPVISLLLGYIIVSIFIRPYL